MKKIIFILLAATSFVACKKNNDAQPGSQADISDKIKKSTFGSGVTTYSYDGSGRLKTKTFSNGGKNEFEYQPGKVIEKEFEPGGVLKQTYTYELNASGLGEKETRGDNPAFQNLRQYNSDKQLVKFTMTGNGTEVGEYFFSNGNCDSLRVSFNGVWQYTNKMTYYTDKLNVLGYDRSGLYFWGQKSKNMVKSERYSYPNGSMGIPENYSYEYDAKGRATKMISEADGDIFITTLSYE